MNRREFLSMVSMAPLIGGAYGKGSDFQLHWNPRVSYTTVPPDWLLAFWADREKYILTRGVEVIDEKR